MVAIAGCCYRARMSDETSSDETSMSDDISVDSILGAGGSISRRLNGYAPREQQLQMARKVVEALSTDQHLVAEAGTGTGKSFAYLVPAILHATGAVKSKRSNNPPNKDSPDKPPRGPRVLISTHTISLQEQLIDKDIPLLNSVIPREFSAVLVKGRGNYLSIRRMERAIGKMTTTFAYDQQYQQMRAIQQWSKTTTDGSLSTLPIKPDTDVWDEAKSDTGNCLGKKCDHFERCFYFKARRRAQHAQLMVVNHAMLFSDVALRKQGVSLLPDYDAVILDECHTIEAVAGDH